MLTVLGEQAVLRRPCALLLGAFDGFHIGHRTLLDAAKQTGLPVAALTIMGGKQGGSLFLPAERRVVLHRLGAAYTLEYTFTEQFRETPAVHFLAALFSRICAGAVFCGEDFRFGAGAEGAPDLLKRMAPCPVAVLPLKEAGGEKVSSSRIKRLLADADMAGANALLCVPYFIQGTVEHGRHVGSGLGFPTVNLALPAEKTFPREGVYGGRAETPAGEFPAIVNIGARPTFGVQEKKIEAYLDGFSGNLYGETVRLFPEEYYRPTTAFPSAEALKEQLARDIARLRERSRK